MPIKKVIICMGAVALLGMASASFAQAPKFFSMLGDVPAMAGLYEVPENHLFFDKPEGRIAELSILMDGVSRADVHKYYMQALPQFGWIARSDGAFLRDGEVLRLQFEGADMMKISVSPRGK